MPSPDQASPQVPTAPLHTWQACFLPPQVPTAPLRTWHPSKPPPQVLSPLIHTWHPAFSPPQVPTAPLRTWHPAFSPPQVPTAPLRTWHPAFSPPQVPTAPLRTWHPSKPPPQVLSPLIHTWQAFFLPPQEPTAPLRTWQPPPFRHARPDRASPHTLIPPVPRQRARRESPQSSRGVARSPPGTSSAGGAAVLVHKRLAKSKSILSIAPGTVGRVEPIRLIGRARPKLPRPVTRGSGAAHTTLISRNTATYKSLINRILSNHTRRTV